MPCGPGTQRSVSPCTGALCIGAVCDRHARRRRIALLRRRPLRHVGAAIRDRRRRPQIVAVTHGRARFGERRHLERKIHAAHAGAFDRLDLHRADRDRAGFQAGLLGLVPPGRALALHEIAAPAAGKRQQHHASRNGESQSAPHGRENASGFFNEASTLRRQEFVRDKDSFPRRQRGSLSARLFPRNSRTKAAYAILPAAESNPTLTPPIWHCFGAIPRPDKFVAVFCTAALLRMPIFLARDQTLARVIPAAHGIGRKYFRAERRNRLRGQSALSASLKPHQQGRLPWPFR